MNTEKKAFQTILDSFKFYEAKHPDKICIEYENETVTYRSFGKKARSIAYELSQYDIYQKRVILIFPMGIEYVLSFFATLFAGAIPVPCYPANESLTFEDRFLHIIHNSEADYVLTMSNEKIKIDNLNNLDINSLNIDWIFMDKLKSNDEEYENYSEITDAFIQYSSGTTSNPKGVMVSHANLMDNLSKFNSLLHTLNLPDDNIVAVSWLPLYHDMGLIGGMLIYITMGHTIHLMPTQKTLSNLYLWMKKISDVKANVTLAPNFAFKACTELISKEQLNTLDLSSLETIINGAEPISIQTLDNFYQYFKETGLKEEVMCPCYGLAEATLLVSYSDIKSKPIVEYFHQKDLGKGIVSPCSADESDAIPIVSCGTIVEGTEVIIVDTDNNVLSEPGRTGEIWIKGPAVTAGYYNNESLSRDIFHSTLASNPTKEYLRTGDLGFYYKENLYICGRMKELIVVNGKNISPSSLEQFILSTYQTSKISKIVFFSVVNGNSENVICLVEKNEELINIQESIQKITNDIKNKFNITLSEVIIVKEGTIEKTESGKIKRSKCKQMYMDGQLQVCC